MSGEGDEVAATSSSISENCDVLRGPEKSNFISENGDVLRESEKSSSISENGDGFREPEKSNSISENGDGLRGPEKGRSCAGCLYFTSQRRDRGKDPLCVGLSRPESRVYSVMGDSEREALKDGRRLLDFKYACLGYSMYKHTTTADLYKQEGNAELPACLGIEFLGVRKAYEGETSPALEAHDPDDGPPLSPRPPSSRPPTIGGIRSDEFMTRFIRSAGLIASAVGNNISRLGGSIKSGIDDIFYSDRRRPK